MAIQKLNPIVMETVDDDDSSNIVASDVNNENEGFVEVVDLNKFMQNNASYVTDITKTITVRMFLWQ